MYAILFEKKELKTCARGAIEEKRNIWSKDKQSLRC